jgi:hypothetical protein
MNVEHNFLLRSTYACGVQRSHSIATVGVDETALCRLGARSDGRIEPLTASTNRAPGATPVTVWRSRNQSQYSVWACSAVQLPDALG